MAPKRKQAPEEENDAPPAGPLKTKRFVVNLARIKGSMGLGIDDQRATMSKARRRHIAGRLTSTYRLLFAPHAYALA